MLDQETHLFNGLTSEPAGSHRFSSDQLQLWFNDLIRPIYPSIHGITDLTDCNSSGFKILIPRRFHISVEWDQFFESTIEKMSLIY